MTIRSTVLGLVCATAAFAQTQSKIAPDVDLSGNPQDVIVVYKTKPGSGHRGRAEGRGARFKKDLSVVRALHYSATGAALRDLANDPEVESIHPNRVVRGLLDNTAAAVNAASAWSAGYTGRGVGVAIIDSGVSVNYVNDTNRVVANVDFTNAWSSPAYADEYGHGTHIAGIIGANVTPPTNGLVPLVTPSRAYKGIAPGVNIINLRVLDWSGSGTDSAVISAIQWAIDNRVAYNIRVMNLSIGRPVTVSYKDDPLCQAVEQAWKAGIVVVTAAGNFGRNNFGGNQGYGTITAPGNDPYVITVGAMNSKGTPARGDDVMASYSSKGPSLIDHVVKPDLVAPGNQIVSTNTFYDSGFGLWDLYGSTNVPFSYTYPGSMGTDWMYVRLSGTSMATPVVTGAVALLLEQNPSLTPDQVKARLMKTAYKQFPNATVAIDATTNAAYTTYYDGFTVGAGYVDIAAALANHDVANGNALSPTAVNNNGTITMVPAAGSVFSTNASSVIWGTQVIWGTSVIWGTQVIWGTSVIWGTNVTQGTQVIWGTGTPNQNALSVIWGTTNTTAIDSLAVLTQGDR